jgi:hypothetical protein
LQETKRKVANPTQFIQLLKLCEDTLTNFFPPSHTAKAGFSKTLKKNEFLTPKHKGNAIGGKLKGEDPIAAKKSSSNAERNL